MGQCNSSPPEVSAATEPEAPVHEGAVLDVKCLPQGLSASCGEDLSIAVFDWNAKVVTTRLQGHSKVVNKVVWSESASGLRLWSCSRDLTIKQWDVANQRVLAEISDAHELSITSLGVTTDQRRLFSGSRDASVKLWDAATMQPVAKTEIARNLVTCIRCLHNEPLALQGSEDLTLRIWDARAMAKPAATLGGYTYFPLCVDVSGGTHHAVTGSKGFNGSGCEIRIWDLRMNAQLRVLSGHQQDVTGCRVTDDGRILTACKDGTIGLWRFDSDEHHLFSQARPNMLSAIDLKVGSGSAEGSGSYGLIGSTYSGALVDVSVTATTTPELKVLEVLGGNTEEEENNKVEGEK